MDTITLVKRFMKPVVLIIASIIFFVLGFNQVGILFVVLYLVDNFYQLNILWKKEEDANYLINKIDLDISKNVANMTIPIALINNKGKIKWHNSLFGELKSCDSKCFNGENIVSIARGLDIDKIYELGDNIHQRLKLNHKLYDVYTTKITIKNDSEFLIYFNDISELIGIDTTKEGIMLVEVDNLAEALDTMEDTERPLLVAEIERMINSYANRLEGMIKRYEKNKYVISILDKFIDEEINSKFEILDEISKINKGNKLEVTLSIGVGRGGMTPQENYKFAVVAKELALGRGGDQVVVKNKDDIKMFGGNSNEIEKRTRVRARVISHALKELIYESSKVFIVGHKNPDMDCFGSALALSSIIRKLGTECNIIFGTDTLAIEPFYSEVKSNKRYADTFITYEEAEKRIDSKTLVIIADVHNKTYIGNLDFVEKIKRKVIIDHHRRSTDIIEDTLLNYIEVYASSTSEMITEIIQYILDKPIVNKKEAEGLLAGIYMDTKGFSFKTGVRTFDAASFLRRMGAETTEVKRLFADKLEEFLQIAETIKSAKVENHTAISVAQDDVGTVIVAKSADELLNISGIMAAFVISNIKGDFYISARSVGDINVQIVLEALGGGGHLNIAGVKISNKSIDEVLTMLNDAIKKYLRVGE